MQLDVSLDATKLEIQLREFKGRVRDLKPLMREIAETMKYAVDDNFATEGHGKWKKTGRGGKILQDTGRLKNSIQAYFDTKKAVVGTNIVYAAIHNFGGKTAPHTIKPRHKKALAFMKGNNMVFAKSVNHPGNNIPARPFLALDKYAIDDINESIQDYFSKLKK